MLRIGSIGCVLLVFALLATSCTEQVAPQALDWPQWRGPDRDGISAETGLADSWPTGGPPAVWRRFDVGEGYGSVAVSGGAVYVIGQKDDAQRVYALDASDGSTLWETAFGEPYDNRRGGGPRSTPTVSGDRLFALGANGELACLSTENGEPLWRVDLQQRFDMEIPHWGTSESPLVDGDVVIVATGSVDGSIVAFDASDGTVAWQSEGLTDNASYASAIAVDVDGVRQVIHFTEDAAVGIRRADGVPLWRYERVANDTANCTTPLFADGRIFMTSAYDTGAALLRPSSDSVEELYFSREMMNHHGGVVLVDGYLYGYTNNIFACVELETAEKQWHDRGVGKGSVIVADGKLIVFSERGEVALVEATPDEYRELGSFSVPVRTYSWGHPAVAGGHLFLRTDRAVHVFDIRG